MEGDVCTHTGIQDILILMGILVLLMGILGLVPDLDMGTEPSWHAALKIAIGWVAIAGGYMDRE